MELAVRTTASPAAIWTIVIVAVVLLAFWLIMVMVYATRPDPRIRQLAATPVGGIPLGAEAPAPEAAQIPGQRGPQSPAEPTPAEATAEPIPAQRAADADTPASAGTTAGDTTPTDTTGPNAGNSRP